MSFFKNAIDKINKWSKKISEDVKVNKNIYEEQFKNEISDLGKQLKDISLCPEKENNNEAQSFKSDGRFKTEKPVGNALKIKTHALSEEIACNNMNLSIGPRKLILHPDLSGLIWFVDGPYKNYSPDKDKKILCEMELYSHRYSLFYSMGDEPSSISVKLPITDAMKSDEYERLPYHPTYEKLTPKQRGLYLRFLSDPFKSVDIGYVFILYYGLERHLLYGDFQKAYNLILKLLKVHNNSSFLYYSTKALVLSCIIRKNPKVIEFMKSFDENMMQSMDKNIFLLCLLTFDKPLTVEHIIFLAKSVGFSNNRYIKMQPKIFSIQLANYLERELGHPYILLREYFIDISQIEKQSVSAFANMSIIENYVQIPNFVGFMGFVNFCNNALRYAHESTKLILKEQRNSSKIT